jgi:cell fate (sporulation/competence/biofilm development) regulator YmcA (YheA/YmcA/DUF963 family)
MQDNLERFIAENRDQFDLYDPDQRLWKGIQARVSRKKTLRIGTAGILWRAAAVIIIFMMSFLVQEYLHRNNIWLGSRERDIETDAIPELKEAEIYYSTLVNEKLIEIQPLIDDFPELSNELSNDLAELDSVYNSLKKDLIDNIANDEVVEAMIQNYRLKLEILEDLLKYLQGTSKTNVNGNNEHDI